MNKNIIKGQFEIDLFQNKVYIIVVKKGSLKDVVNNYLSKYGDKRLDYDISGFCYDPDKRAGHYYLFLDSDGLTVNTITHETAHLTHHIYVFNGVKESGMEREIEANLSGHINEQVFNFLAKNKIKYKTIIK